MSIGIAKRSGPQSRQRKSKIQTIPAPTGGVNARDALANMPGTDAVSMVNMFPTPSYVAARNGYQVWSGASGSGPAETLMAFNGLTFQRLFVAAGGQLRDASTQGVIQGSTTVTGLQSTRFQHCMFNAGGGNRLLAVNGVDVPLAYDGSNWAAMTISGTNTLTSQELDPTKLITVTVHQQRVWYIEDKTMNVWYAPTVSAYQGALIFLPLGQLFKKGGYLMQMGVWTIDDVSGINDYAVFITSMGEVAVYQGYDPSSVATWSLVGTFSIGRPLGRRCIVKYASDILVICDDGLAPLSKELLTDRTQPDALLTNKIVNAINLDVQNYGDNFGWQCVEHPLGNKLILNVPEIEDGQAHQWVMNTVSTSNAWTKFVGWTAVCWEVQGDNLFFGDLNGNVIQADVGYSDGGLLISVDVQQAFSYLGYQGNKEMQMARVVSASTFSLVNAALLVSVDYQPTSTLVYDPLGNPVNFTPVYQAGSPPAAGALTSVQKSWQGVGGVGYAISGRLTFQIANVSFQWQATDYMYVEAGPL